MAGSPLFTLHQGTAPLLVSVPHAGTQVPDEIADRLAEHATPLPDTDWHVDRLYAFAKDLGASMLVSQVSRYVVDLNRPPDDTSLYPGQTTTGLIPIDTFHGEPIYQHDIAPDLSEEIARVEFYWQPYHTALADELARIKADHGHAVLWDAHSICSQLPRLFDGTLPDFNLGTNSGKSCDAGLFQRVHQIAEAAEGYDTVQNGRFKGGFITRNYGAPETGIHGIQLELSQRTYMNEAAPYDYREDLAGAVQPHLRAMLQCCLDWKP